jgi:HSP20 family protein
MRYPARYAPAREMDSLRREMSRLFDDFFPSNDNDNGGAVFSPRADIRETQDAYVIHLDLPGVQKDNVEVTMEDGTLKVAGERKMVHEEGEDQGQYHRIERRYGRFFRTFHFGQNADPERIEAHFADGQLELRVAKAEARKPRRIEIQ